MQRIERQRRQNSDKAELSRLLPAAGVERLTDDATKRKALDQLPRRINGALMKEGEARLRFKAFVLLRLPVSILLLLAFGALWFLGAVGFVVALLDTVWVLGYLGVVTANLWRRRPGALRQMGLLLAIEWAGAVIWVGARDSSTGPNYMLLVDWACVVVVVWVLPNVAILYKARSLFVEPAKEKPGL